MNMSTSEDSDDEVPSVSRRRKTRIRSLDSEDEIIPTKRKLRKSSASNFKDDSEDCSSKTPNKNLKTPSTRSSDRLRKKKEFKLPSRDEILEDVSPGIVKSSTKKMRELKPRRLVNNFIRERNSYASEKVGDIYLTDDSFSDFIDDGDEDDVDEDDSSDDSESSDKETKKRKAKRKKHRSSSSGSDSKRHSTRKGKSSKTKKKSRNKVKRKRKEITSSSDEELSKEGDSDEPLSAYLDRKNNKKKQAASNMRQRRVSTRRKIFDSSDSENSSGEDKPTCNEEDSPEKTTSAQPVRRSSRRMKLIEKEQIRNQKYEMIKKGRKKSNTNQSSDMNNKETMKCDDDKNEVLQSLIDNYSTDESDKNFVVSDKEISEDEPESDFEYTFLKLKDSQSPDPQSTDGALNSSPSKASIRMRRKQRNQTSKWKRINTKVESDEIEDSESNDNEEYDHGSQLHSAVKNNNIDLIKEILLKEPGSVNELGYRKRSPLHLAALSGNAEVVQLLLKSKANSKLLDKYGFPPIAYAANGHSESLKVLLRHTDIKKVYKSLIHTDSKMSLLHLAIGESRTGDECDERAKCMELLFAHDKETCIDMLYHKDARGRAPLEAAFYASQHKCVRILLENGANPLSFRTGEDGNLLHFAVEAADHLKGLSIEGKDSSLCLREIIEPMKPHLNDKDLNDFTPLMYACESGNDKCLSVLIDAGATVLTKDKYETSPLHLAALAGSTECVQLLLSNGHPVDCVDKSGWPPLLYADFNAKEECVLALMKPKPRQLFILGRLLKRQRTAEDKKKTFKVVKYLLMSLANHDAYYTVFNDFIRDNPELLDEYNHGLLQHTWRAILDFNNKHAWFKRKLYALPETSCWNACSLVVKRSDVLGSTMQRIGHVLGNKLRSNSFHVTFEDEPGICTGPKREFFICFCKDVVSSNRGLFAETDDCQYSPIPNAYFSTLIPDAPQPEPSPHKEVQQEVKAEQNNEGISIEDCITDSELLAIDIEAATDLVAIENSTTDGVTNDVTVGVTDGGVTHDSTTGDVATSDIHGDGMTGDDATGDCVTSTDITDSGIISEAITTDGVTSEGVTADGVTSEGVTADGVTSDDVGVTDDDITDSGITDDGATPRDVTSSGIAFDGDRPPGVPGQELPSSGHQPSSSDETPISQESRTDNSSDNSQQTNPNTWISCVGKKNVVIPSIALRSKMKQLRLIGRIVGSAICQDMHLNFHLSKPFIKQVLGIPLSHPDDLASFDHQLHKTMVVWVQENSVDDLELPFSIETINPWTGKLVTVNLSDDEQKTLDDSNKDEYVKLVSQFKLETFIKKELEEFKIGLNEVIPGDLLTFFTADEFSLLMNGVTKIDVEDWRKNTRHSGFEQFPYIIDWFWDIVSKLKEDEKALLLQFSTGSPCVPLGGFSKLKGLSTGFQISKHLGMNKIPHAATCFNLLQLSDYDSEKQLREKLLIAIRHGSEGFSFS